MKQRPFFKFLRILIFVLVCLVTLVALVIAEENLRGKRAWDQCKRDLEARGEHLDTAYFIPPPVPDDQNFAMTPLFKSYFFDPKTGASSDRVRPQQLDQLALYAGYSQKSTYPKSKGGGWQTGQPRDLEAWKTYYSAVLPGQPSSQSPEQDVIAVIDKLNPIFTELREALKTHPQSRFPIAYEKGPGANLPHYAPIQRLVILLSLRATAELRSSRTQDAFEDIQLGFQLSNSTSADPFLIGGLFRISCTSVLIGPIWEGIATHRWTGDQLANFQAELRQIDYLSEYSRSIRMERTIFAGLMDLIQKDPRILTTGYEAEPFSNFEKTLLPLIRFLPGWLYQNAANESRWFQENLMAVDEIYQRVDLQAVARSEELENKKPMPTTFLAKIVTAPCISTLPKFTAPQNYVNEAIIACAIERYRIAHGVLPATLDALHMPDLPHDIITGAPLHYSVTGDDNYLLYSIGWNGTDDGGKIAKKENGSLDPMKGDWVWSLKPL